MAPLCAEVWTLKGKPITKMMMITVALGTLYFLRIWFGASNESFGMMSRNLSVSLREGTARDPSRFADTFSAARG